VITCLMHQRTKRLTERMSSCTEQDEPLLRPSGREELGFVVDPVVHPRRCWVFEATVCRHKNFWIGKEMEGIKT
jgi:hypothetical protein